MINRTIRAAREMLSSALTAAAGTIRSVDLLAPESSFECLEARVMMSAAPHGVPLITPTNVAAVVVSPTSVRVSWSDTDSHITGFYVLRSDNGGGFATVGKVTSAKTLVFTDGSAKSGHAYQYKVESHSVMAVSAVSKGAAVTVALAAPTGLTGTLQGTTSVKLSWKDNDGGATGYTLYRSTDGVHFSQLVKLSGSGASSYTDTKVVSGTVYSYEVAATSTKAASAVSGAAQVVVALAAPHDLHLSPQATAVTLTWSGDDAHAKNIIVQRSQDGAAFTTLVTLGPTATSYVDSKLATATVYSYRVEAVNSNGVAVSGAVSTVTGVLAPSGLKAVVSGTTVSLSWSDANRAGMGYMVLRSTDGKTFSLLAQLGAGAAKGYVDGSVSAGKTYYYEVKATSGSATSGVSNVVGIAVPKAAVVTPVSPVTPAKPVTPAAPAASTVTITTRYTNELVVTAYGAADNILVSQSGGLLTIVADGQTFSNITMPGSLFVYDQGGADVITVASSVKVRTTITALGAGATTVSSGNANLSAWLDSTDKFSGSGTVHMIGALAGGVSKASGASLANPTDSGTTMTVNMSLWGNGPTASDVNQGGVGDCYFLASLAAFAGGKPLVVQEAAVDLGDGTYLVQFMKNNAPVYVRVSNDLPTGGYYGYEFAHPGADQKMWAPIMEKAFAYFRTGANTYASISSGWMSDVYTDLGVKSINFSMTSSEGAFYAMIAGDLANGKAVTFGTNAKVPNLVGGHAYTLVSASIDAKGVTQYVVRNPWGVSGDSMENSAGYATLTYAQVQANFLGGTQAA